MRKIRTNQHFVWPVLVIAVLLIAACAPVQFPTAAVPPTGGTPEAGTTPDAGQIGGEDDEEGGSTIPPTGETGEQIPPSGDLDRFPEAKPPTVPRITLTRETVTPGQEIVIQGTGFDANSTVLIFAGRPDIGVEKDPLTSARANEQGFFTAHTVLPADLPADALTAGQLLLVAAGEDEQVLAQIVAQTGAAGEVGDETGEPGEPAGEIDLSQLGFDFEGMVLPQLNQTLGSNYTMDNLSVTRLEPTRWPNGCLGLGAADEFCTQQIVPGYRIVVNIEGQPHEIRTNESGSQVRVNQDLD